ncbi:MAG TPA: thermostable hemolysin, partial [Kineobactrum sp.]
CTPRQVMELGNLVASTAGEGSLLYLLVTAAIHDAGVPYLVFAANRAVRLSICRSGFTPVVIGPATAECLGGASAQWGRYYEGDPMVMLGDMALTRQQVLARPAMAATVHRYRAPISALAAVIRQHCA